jgi:ribosomal RNA-processing protein 17
VQLREQRKVDLEKHVEEVNRLVKQANGDMSEAGETSGGDDDDNEEEEFTGFQEPEPINQEDEYIDEDKYTTVTIESVGISKAGFSRPGEDEQRDTKKGGKEGEGGEKKGEGEAEAEAEGKKRVWTKAWPKNNDKPKKKKKKFRYETKTERKAERMKQGMKKRKQKEARTSK